MKKSTCFWMVSLFFSLGIILGILFSPKSGMYFGNNDCNCGNSNLPVREKPGQANDDE